MEINIKTGNLNEALRIIQDINSDLNKLNDVTIDNNEENKDNTENLEIQKSEIEKINEKKEQGLKLSEKEASVLKEHHDAQLQQLNDTQELTRLKAELKGMDIDSIEYQKMLKKQYFQQYELLKKQGAKLTPC